jgi:hypothetical protein
VCHNATIHYSTLRCDTGSNWGRRTPHGRLRYGGSNRKIAGFKRHRSVSAPYLRRRVRTRGGVASVRACCRAPWMMCQWYSRAETPKVGQSQTDAVRSPAEGEVFAVELLSRSVETPCEESCSMVCIESTSGCHGLLGTGDATSS